MILTNPTLTLGGQNGSPPTEYRILPDYDNKLHVQFRAPESAWLDLSMADVCHHLHTQTRVGRWIFSHIISSAGESLWGDEWQGRMAVALDVPRGLVSDWTRARRSPERRYLVALSAMLAARRMRINQAHRDLYNVLNLENLKSPLASLS